MPAKEIKELRQSGRLEEALEMARNEYQADPQNIWTKRNLSWVYYEYLKANASVEKYNDFVSWLNQMVALELPEDEKMLFDSLSFQLGKLLFAMAKVEPIPIQKINQIFELVQNFHFTKPSDGYSFLLKGFHKGLKDTSFYLEFIDWWDLENLAEQDFKKEKLPTGKEIMALAEQVYIAYAKQLLPREELITNENLEFVIQEKRNSVKTFVEKGIPVRARVFNREMAESFIHKLEELTQKHPNYQYPPYFQAKLLLALGDTEDVLSALIPFARKKQNDFWVWEILAEAVESDQEKVFSCHCRALVCTSPEEMLVGARQKMAELLIHRGLYNEAKTEIGLILKVKETHGHRIPALIDQWISEPWYSNAQASESNKSFYLMHTALAEEILFADTPEELVFVEFVNADKSILDFMVSEEKFGFFKFDRFLRKVQPGDVLSVRFNGGAKGGRYNVLTCVKVNNETFKSQFQKEVEGPVRIKEGSSFGFIGDAFIQPSLISKYNLSNGQTFKGQIIKTYDSRKEKWGWKLA
jgi:tetratricopeptide (TPR) repeat protein